MATISASPLVTSGLRRSRVQVQPLIPGVWTPDAPQKDGEASIPSAGATAVAVPQRYVRLLLAVIGVFVLGLIVSAALGQASSSSAAAQAPAATGPIETAAYPAYTVASGDTLWTIAQRVQPDVDPRAVVLQLRVLNNLPPQDVLHAGDVLLLPAQ